MKKTVSLAFISFMFWLSACTKDESSLSADNSTGVNGSITRFVINDNFMYAIDFNYLKTFDISSNDNPLLVSSVKVGYGIETIFYYDNYLYLGANDGVYVISLSDPYHPVQLEKVQHTYTCDPVVVQGNFAYSTQRANASGCGNTWTVSSLVVYNVTNPAHATISKTISMVQPYGLAVEDDWLYVCDEGQGGIAVFELFGPADLVQRYIVGVANPRDIILRYPYMIVATDHSFELYNYSNPLNIIHISTLTIT